MRQSFESTGKAISDELLAEMAYVANGFPYMMQLVGYEVWVEARDAETIAKGHVDRGIELAKVEFEENVLKSTFGDMSEGDRRFAAAMLPESSGRNLSEIAKIMGKGVNYASIYKKRLLKRGVIEEAAGGSLTFAIPLFGEYLAAKLQTK